ncbi:MAG: AAA family ATPase [Vicinamibacterales bacterium]
MAGGAPVAARVSRGIQKRGYAWKKHYGESAPGCRFVQHPVQISNDKERRQFITGVTPLQPKLIVLDTLATMTVGMDENDTGEMGRFTAACREIANALEATVLVIHHPTKGDPNGYRGSYQLEGNFDAMIRVKRDENNDLQLHCAKQKDEDKFPDFNVSVQSITLSEATGEHDAITS